MSKRVIISIGEGSFEEGFPVTLQIGEEGKPPKLTLSENLRLPPASELWQNYWQWQESYYQIPTIRQARICRIVVPENQITNRSSSEQLSITCQAATQELTQMMTEWFNNSTFQQIREIIQEEVEKKETLRVILETNDSRLWRLPWHLWTLFEKRPNSELSLSLKSYRQISSKKLKSPLKILGILGNGTKLDLETDRQLLTRLKKRGARITWLEPQTRKNLVNLLWQERWDILFFAGHSYTEAITDRGFLQINEYESISLAELKNTLINSVEKGLQLAIFNSCDGLGLARDLAEVNIPHVIVMREPIPDRVAQHFLEYFLASFSQGKSLNLSVKDARVRLKDDQHEHTLPCADWLPVIFQNQASAPLYWDKAGYKKWILPIVLAVFPLGLIPVFYQPVSQRISECENLLIKENIVTAKQEGVNACRAKNFVLAQRRFEESLRVRPNDPETRIYLENIKIGSQSAWTLGMSVPIGSNLNVAQEMLRGAAQAQIEINQKGGIAGRLIKIKIANDNNEPKIGTEIAIILIKAPQIIAVVGHNASDVSVTVAPVYNQGKLVMITPTSFSDKLSSSGDYIFRVVPSIRFIADTLADYMVGHEHKKKTAICSSTLAVDNESFRNQFTNSWQSKAGEYIGVDCNFDHPNFDPQAKIAEIISSGADSLLLAPHVDRIEKAVSMARANQGRLTLFASPTLYTSLTLKSGRGDVNGLILAVPWHPETARTLPKARLFINEALELWKGPVNWRTASSYDAILAIAEGLKKSETRAGLKDAMRNPGFSVEGATGTIKFLPSGDRQYIRGSFPITKIRPNSNTESGYEFGLVEK